MAPAYSVSIIVITLSFSIFISKRLQIKWPVICIEIPTPCVAMNCINIYIFKIIYKQMKQGEPEYLTNFILNFILKNVLQTVLTGSLSLFQ